MIKLKQLLETATYVSNCVDDESTAQIFDSATDMAYMIENSDLISYQEFIKLVNLTGTPRMLKLHLRRNPDDIAYGKHKDLIWAHDTIDDIHYFFL